MPRRTTVVDPGTCYLAPELEGVIVERVIRDMWRPVVSLGKMKTEHALARSVLRRDLVLVDLIKTVWTVHRMQVHEVTAPPPFTRTLALAAELVASSPVNVDGIAYSSRFGSGVECVALWDRAATALSWQGSEPLGADEDAFAKACENLGIGLLP